MYYLTFEDYSLIIAAFAPVVLCGIAAVFVYRDDHKKW